MTNELVTIYIISKNREPFLRRAISSCQNQTYQNLEIIVVDDCSDNFDIFSLQKDFPLVNFHRMEASSGANICRNKALSKAKGTYITGLDDDDLFTEDRIKKMLSVLNEKGVKAVSSRHLFERVFHCYTFRDRVKFAIKKVSLIFPGKLIFSEDLLNKNIVGNQIFTQTSILRKIGGFDVELPALQDYETWLRFLIAIGPIYRVNDFLYIKNDETVSITNFNRKKLLGFDYIFNKYQDYFSGFEHCFSLHKKLYENKVLTFREVIRFWKKGNRVYLLKLMLTLKVKGF